MSAAMRLAPVMPTSACRNFWRRIWRAKKVSSSPVSRGKSRFKLAFEERSDALATVVERRREDVGRLLAGQLKNEFGEVAFDDFDAIGFEGVIEANFFRGDALPFDDHFCGAPAADVLNVAAGIGGRCW